MAELFVSVIADKVLGKLGSLAYQELLLGWAVRNDIQELFDTLNTIKTVLLDAEEQQYQNPKLRLWLEKLKEICYDAEDVLDEIEAQALTKQVIAKHGSITRKVSNFFSSPKSLAFRFKVGHKIKEIKERLHKIAADKTNYNLTERVDRNRHVMSNERETHSFIHSSDVIGRDEDKEKIIQQLIYTVDVENVTVIPIVGIGGLGKTTLAKLVYNDKRVDFELKIWICISDEFILKKIIIDIVNSATGQDHSNKNLDGLQEILRDTLSGKRYLIVMDDVWNENPNLWIELRNLLPGGKGSKIIVTTRSDQVASIMGTVPSYKLEGLSHEECLLLFVKCAFREGQERQHPNLIEIGKEIVKKCGGAPLAVRTLGSLLYSLKDEYYWKSMRDSDIWRLEQKKDDILPALRLSYDHLSSYLKPCFAYCSIFPKDYLFLNFELIQFWMAHGLLQHFDENQDLENIGNQYLKELASRSFFQDFDEGGYDTFYRFKMHDLMHDLAASLMKSEWVILNSRSQRIPRTVRHLTFVDAETLEIEFSTSLPTYCHVRTILLRPITGDETSQSVFAGSVIQRFKSLRLLDLRGCDVEALPEKNIGNLKHLRFLSLRENRKIKKLPNSICKLHSLQTLFLQFCNELEELPGEIRYLINLRMLSFTTKQRCLPKNGIGCLNSLRFLGILGCENLENLFEDIDGLRVLRTLVIGGCPKLISLTHNIKHLSSLENLILDNCESLLLNSSIESGREDNRQYLNSTGPPLRMLWIQRLPKFVELPQWLLQGTIQTLHIEACWNFKALPESIQNLKSLQLLRIRGCPELSSLPENMNRLVALRELTIRWCPKLISLTHNIKYLSSLENLILDNCESLILNTSNESGREDNRQDLNTTGPPLQMLLIESLPKLVELPQWMLQGTLQTLHIEDCSEFKALPESIQNLKSLQLLRIKDCPELSSLPEDMNRLTALRELTIRLCPNLIKRCEPEKGEDWPKIAHIPNIEIDWETFKRSN